jgi:hypothetical protein
MPALVRALLFSASLVIGLAATGCSSNADGDRRFDGGAAESDETGGSSSRDAGSRVDGPLEVLDASVDDARPAEDASRPSTVCTFPEPPPIVMSTSTGEQQGANGSFCSGRSACFVCADRGIYVRGYTVVRPGDEITFSMPDGTLMGGGSACVPDCPPVLRVYVTCKRQYRELKSVPLHEDEPWRPMLAPGSYILLADSHFTGNDGSGGGTSAAFGLIVDTERERGSTDAPYATDDCETPEELDAGAEL